MGMVYVDAEVSRGDEQPRLIRFLLDSGAVYSVLPHDEWQALSLTPQRRMEFVVDGTSIERDVSHCMFTYAGIRAPSPVVPGLPGDEALLGSLTLENMGLVLDPFNRTLRPMRAKLAALRAA